MPQTSTGAASTSILATCQVPDAGDFVTGAGFKAAIDPVNNDLASLEKRVGGGLTTYVAQAWYVDSGGGFVATLPSTSTGRTSVPVGGEAAALLLVPHGSRLTSMTVRFAPSAHANLPATKPIVRLRVLDPAAGSTISTTSVTDTTSPVAAYNAAHDVTVTPGSPLDIDLTQYVYMAIVVGEDGADADALPIALPEIALL